MYLYGAKTTTGRIGRISTDKKDSAIISEPPGIGKPLRGAQSNVEQDGAEAVKDFWSIQGDFIYHHHIEARAQLHVPKEETFPVPLKDIHATRSTFTNLDVLQEQRFDDFRNMNVNKIL